MVAPKQSFGILPNCRFAFQANPIWWTGGELNPLRQDCQGSPADRRPAHQIKLTYSSSRKNKEDPKIRVFNKFWEVMWTGFWSNLKLQSRPAESLAGVRFSGIGIRQPRRE